MEKNNELKTLVVDGGMYKTSFTKKFENRQIYELPNDNQIISFMPGSIVDILVKKGQKVEEGEVILILEAMKMYNNITMPFKGRITKINVKRDEVIPKNYVILEIEPI